MSNPLKSELYNINLTTTVDVERENYSDVGSSDNIVGDYARLFKGGVDFEIWTDATAGIKLIENTDYELINQSNYYSTLLGSDVYTGYKIINAIYETGDLYFNYKILGSIIDKTIVEDLQSAIVGNTIDVYTSDELSDFLATGKYVVMQGQELTTTFYPELAVARPRWVDITTVGKITIPDWTDRVGRNAGTLAGSLTTAFLTQEDQAQGWQLGATEDLSGTREYFGTIDDRDYYQGASSLASHAPLQMTTGGQGNSRMLKAINDGTNGDYRSGLETRAKSIIIEKLVRVAI